MYEVTLRILKVCASRARRLATKIIKGKVYDSMMPQLQIRYGKLMSSESQVPQEEIMGGKNHMSIQEFKILALEIETLSALFKVSPEDTNLVKEQILSPGNALIENGLPFKLCNILYMPNIIDPLILTALCKLTLSILNQECIQTNPKLLKQLMTSICYCKELLPYCFEENGGKYYQLQQYAEMHKPSSNSKQEVIKMENDENPIVHATLIAIIELINYFCEDHQEVQPKLTLMEKEGLNQLQIQDKIEKIKEQLDEVNQEAEVALDDYKREDALFKCLKVQNDHVKLATVRCLFYVNLEQLSAEEVEKLMENMKSRNIGAGQTEYVLAHIFWIFSHIQTDPIISNLHKQQCATAVKYGQEILDINQNRVVNNIDELKEKYILSASVVSYLRLYTNNMGEQNKSGANWQNKMLKKILYGEMHYTTHQSWRQVPISIEDTHLGSTIEKLIKLLKTDSSKPLKPFNFTTFRIYHRIGNLLSNQVKGEIFGQLNKEGFTEFQSSKNIMSKMINFYRKEMRLKIMRELRLWTDIDANLVNDLRKEEHINFKTFRKNHDDFDIQAISNLMKFLTNSSKKESSWLQMNSKNLRFDGFNENLFKAQEQEEKKRAQENELKKNLSKAQTLKYQEEIENPFKLYKTNFNSMVAICNDTEMNEGYQEFCENVGFKAKETEDEIQVDKSSDDMQQKLNQFAKAEPGIESFEMRVLCVSALLRILYASIQFAPTKEQSEKAIKNLKNKNNRFYETLTKLCNSTGWLEGNIGVKFLLVMKFTLTLDHNQRHLDIDEFNKYMTYSQVIKQILQILDKELSGEGQVGYHVKAENYLLINQICATSYQICQQTSFFDNHLYQDKSQNNATTASSSCYKLNPELSNHIKLYFQDLSQRLKMLFNFSAIKTIISVLFRDMERAFSVFDQQSQNEADQDKCEIENASEMDDALFYEVRNAVVSTREHIKMFLGLLIALSEPDLKYKIIEHINRNIIFGSKCMRKSIYNEILILSKQEKTMRQLSQLYFESPSNSKKFNLNEISGEKISIANEHTVLARVAQVQIWASERHGNDYKLFKQDKTQKKYQTRFLVFTNRGIYIFNDNQGKNKDNCECKPKKLCPHNNCPELIFSFRYNQLHSIRKFNLAVQKVFLTFKKIELEPKQQKQYQQYFKGGCMNKDNSYKYVTLVILFHRLNGAYFITQTIEKFSAVHETMYTTHIDFMLEYSLLVNAAIYMARNKDDQEKTEVKLKPDYLSNIQPEIVRYVSFYSTQKEFQNKMAAYEEHNKYNYKLTYECVPQEFCKNEGFSLPNMRILVITSTHLFLFLEHNENWTPHNILDVAKAKKEFKLEIKSQGIDSYKKGDEKKENEKVEKQDARVLTSLKANNNGTYTEVFRLESLVSIHPLDSTVPALELTFSDKRQITLVFVGDLSREQVLELLIEMREYGDQHSSDSSN